MGACWVTKAAAGLPGEVPAQPADPGTGVELHGEYYVEALGNLSGGYTRGVAEDAWLEMSLQADLGRLFKIDGWKGAAIYSSAIYTFGKGITERFTHDLNGASNIEAYDSLRLEELWVEQTSERGLAVRAGTMTLDSEFAVCNSGQAFINSCFGALPLISLNMDAPVAPLAAPGVRIAYNAGERLTLRAAGFSGDVGAQSLNNRHGLRASYHSEAGLLIVAEAVYQRPGARPASYTLGGYYHSGRFEELGNPGTYRRNLGSVYGVADVALFREAASEQGLNGFGRAGLAFPGDRTLVTFYAEAGLAYTGLIRGRDADSCGVACSYTRLSHEAPDAQFETVTEAFYLVVANQWLSVQPHVQYIGNPGGTGELSSAWVGGVRVHLAF